MGTEGEGWCQEEQAEDRWAPCPPQRGARHVQPPATGLMRGAHAVSTLTPPTPELVPRTLR